LPRKIIMRQKTGGPVATNRGLPAGLKPLFHSHQIADRLKMLAAEIQKRVPARERPIAVVVLQGAFIFAADLLRQFSPGYGIDVAFLRCESYGSGTTSSGKVLLLQDIDHSVDLHGRTVILIDDILDSGLTMEFLMQHLRQRGASRVRVCVLLHRTKAARRKRVKPDFAGFGIGPAFVVGYGLDYDGRYRHLPDLAALQIAKRK
jgi:hypoxanthine phosphoribosyltransferase